MAENTIDNLSIQVTASAENAARVFDRLASSAGKVKNAASGAAGGMQDMAQGAQDAGTATQEAGTQAGKARPNIKGVGKDAKDAGESAKKGTAGISSFWQALKRVAFYRFVRTVLKEIGNAFKEGAQNLYQWSAANPGLSDFAKNMNRIATSVLYLKNSLGAMLQPIVRILAPIIDGVIDGIVKVINLINQLFSALSGATTYTVAKKVATTWADTGKTAASSAKKAADDIKRTILGFDEINKLEKQNTSTSSSGIGSNTPGTAVSDMFETKPLDGWAKALSDFINKIKKWMQPVLDWFDKLGNKIKHLWDGFVDGAKDFFSDPLDWLKKNVADPITHGLRKLFGINSPSTEMKIIGTYLIQGLKEGMLEELAGMDNWLKSNVVDVIKKAFGSKSAILYFSPKLDNRPEILYNTFMREWNRTGSKALYFSPKLDNTASVLYNDFKRDWDNSGSKSLYFSPKLDNDANTLYDGFKRDWDNTGNKYLYFSPKLDNTAKALYDGFKRDWDSSGSKTLYFSPKLDNTARTLYNSFRREWSALGAKILYLGIKLNNTAKVLLDNFKKDWNMADPVVDVEVNLKKKNWNTVTKYIDDSFGGATGGGGRTSGGGAGRDYGVSVSLHENQTGEESKNLWGIWWDIAKKTLKLEQDVVVKLVEGWYGTPESALGIDNLTVDATPKWDKYSNGIYGYLNIDDLSTTVKIKTQTAWDYFGKTIKQYLGLNDLSTTVKVKLKATGKGVELQQTTGGSGGGWKLVTRAAGGAIDRLGRVSNFANGGIINAYAGGTTNAHGTMFLAGENGPEIMGHVGGRTEILNRSQLAATMYSAVRNAMSGVTLEANFNNVDTGANSVDSMEMLAEMVRQGVEQAMARQNELDRQRNEYLRQINDKDYNIDISTASINKAQTRTNRRAGTTIVPIGT